MRRALMILTLGAALASGEIVDRVVASVGAQVVTAGAISRMADLEAFLSNSAPRTKPADRREMAQRLVEQALVRREIELSRFSPISRADAEQQIASIQKDLGLDEAALRARLALHRLSYEDLYDEARWQLTLFRFVEFRFRPGVQVGEQEIAAYYNGELVEEVRKAGRERPDLDSLRETILRILTERKVQGALEQWLEQASQQVRVRYREEAFQ
jgi:peptidyl-prolyl cis-trans isomerase SurA